MKQLIKGYLARISENIASRVALKTNQNTIMADNITYRSAAETILNNNTMGKQPHEIFYGVSDDFWFWLNTEGVRKNQMLRKILPGVPDDYTQEMYTGGKGDATLWQGFYYYKLFKEQYEKYKGDISTAQNVLDYGCGWGRVIRFFIKDIQSPKIWGCDPVPEMIKLCKEQNKWCNFESINTYPPTPFQENMFDLIYSFSVFSHLSEDFHIGILEEIKRILKPGGIYVTTTRNRQFIEICAQMRNRDLTSMNPGPKSSSQAFPDTQKSLSDFDQGLFCHYSFSDKKWPYWGESVIPKKYVLDHWAKNFTVLDYIESDMQNIIVIQKPFDKA